MSIVLDVMYMLDQVIMRYSICMARPIQEQGALEEKKHLHIQSICTEPRLTEYCKIES